MNITQYQGIPTKYRSHGQLRRPHGQFTQGVHMDNLQEAYTWIILPRQAAVNLVPISPDLHHLASTVAETEIEQEVEIHRISQPLFLCLHLYLWLQLVFMIFLLWLFLWRLKVEVEKNKLESTNQDFAEKPHHQNHFIDTERERKKVMKKKKKQFY